MEDGNRRREEDRYLDPPPVGIRAAASEASPRLAALGERVALTVDLRLFPIPVVMQAAYQLTNETYVFVDTDPSDPHTVNVVLTPKASGRDLSALAGTFTNALVDHRVRSDLRAEFCAVQELIVAQAFSDTNLLSSDDGDDDVAADPHTAGNRR
jgi:His-Xaa-Ser system protein HxsD